MSTVLAVLIAGAALSGEPIAACPTSRFRVDLVAREGAVAVSGDLSLAEIRALHERSGQAIPHEPIGFYVSSFHYAVQIEDVNTPGCQNPLRIRLEMDLDGRHIVVGREVMRSDCRRAAALAHYRRHADADEAVFNSWTARVKGMLHSPGLDASLRAVGRDEPGIRRVLRSALERETPEFDAWRRAAQAAVDTSGQVEALESACKTNT